MDRQKKGWLENNMECAGETYKTLVYSPAGEACRCAAKRRCLWLASPEDTPNSALFPALRAIHEQKPVFRFDENCKNRTLVNLLTENNTLFTSFQRIPL